MALRGYISTYWEQGWEGDDLLVFQDAAYIEGDRWSLDGMYTIQPGDRLTIYATDGRTLWSGVVPPPPTRIDRILQSLGLQAPSLPADWSHWFRGKEKLEAEYEPRPPRADPRRSTSGSS